MTKAEKIAVFGLLIVMVFSVVGLYAKERNVINFGGYESGTYTDSSTASSSVPTTATTTNPILTKDSNRQGAKVCYLSGTSTVFLHPKGLSTTTDVVVNEGIPLYPTSTQAQTCQEFPRMQGYLFGIAENAATVTVEEH